MASKRSTNVSTRMLRLELSEPIPAVDLARVDELWVLAMYHGVPLVHLRLAAPGQCAQPQALLAALVGRRAAPQVAFDRLCARIEQRIGPAPAAEHIAVSVVVCTHRRPAMLARVLSALHELDPPPAEIVVVDNAPERDDSRRLVEQHDARYVREHRKGLDIARAAGVRAARGEVIAFTDDDAIPAARWLGNAAKLFADPLVGCVTGPVLPYEFATPAQARHERWASLNRGLVPRVEDWTTLAAGLAPELGVGANMLFRRDALKRPELMFPAELDAGTPCESGGDGYALYRIIADGWRAVYDPETYVFHDHRREADSFRRAVRGYGIGLGSWTATVLTRDRDVGSLALGLTPFGTLRAAIASRIAGRGDEFETRVAWDLLRGLGMSPVRLRRARRAVSRGMPDALALATDRTADQVRPAHHAQALRSLSVSVVMLGAVRGTSAAADAWLAEHPNVDELIAPDSGSETREATLAAASARARGDILLVWTAGLEPHGDVIGDHIAAHIEQPPGIAVGDLHARCADARLATRLRVRELSDHSDRARRAAALTFLDVGDVNVSFSTELLRRVGGLDPDFGAGCILEAALRACAAGGELRRSPARATLTCCSTFTDLAAMRRDAGESASRLAAAHADRAPILDRIVTDQGPYTLVDRVMSATPAMRARAVVLAGLERARLRDHWARTARAALAASFRRGVASAAALTSPAVAGSAVVDLDSNEPIILTSLGAHPATLRLGGAVAGFTDALGSWTSESVSEIARGVDPRVWAPLIDEVTRGESPDLAALPTLTVLLGSEVADTAVHVSAQPDDLHVRVEVLPPLIGLADFWAAIDEAIKACVTELVAVPLPGRSVSRDWASEVRLALSGSAVGIAAGIGLAEPWAAQPVTLLSERHGAHIGVEMAAMDYIAVRPAAYTAAGGLDSALGAVGDHGPPCHLLCRHLAHGGTAAWTVAPGIGVRPGARHNGVPATAYGAALAASARKGDPNARGLFLITALQYISAPIGGRSIRGVLIALRELARFTRGALAGL